MRPPSVDGILVHVLEDVVHPAHVPFVGEPEAAQVNGPADTGPCRRFLRRRDRTWMLASA